MGTSHSNAIVSSDKKINLRNVEKSIFDIDINKCDIKKQDTIKDIKIQPDNIYINSEENNNQKKKEDETKYKKKTTKNKINQKNNKNKYKANKKKTITTIDLEERIQKRRHYQRMRYRLKNKSTKKYNNKKFKILENTLDNKVNPIKDIAILEDLKKKQLCGICFGIQYNNRCQPCGHTFCNNCINKLFQDSSLNSTLCPYCKKSFNRRTLVNDTTIQNICNIVYPLNAVVKNDISSTNVSDNNSNISGIDASDNKSNVGDTDVKNVGDTYGNDNNHDNNESDINNTIVSNYDPNQATRLRISLNLQFYNKETEYIEQSAFLPPPIKLVNHTMNLSNNTKICFTGLNTIQEAQIKNFCNIFKSNTINIDICNDIDSNNVHLITPAASVYSLLYSYTYIPKNNQKEIIIVKPHTLYERTQKYFLALLYGCPIICYDWILACIYNQKIIDICYFLVLFDVYTRTVCWRYKEIFFKTITKDIFYDPFKIRIYNNCLNHKSIIEYTIPKNQLFSNINICILPQEFSLFFFLTHNKYLKRLRSICSDKEDIYTEDDNITYEKIIWQSMLQMAQMTPYINELEIADRVCKLLRIGGANVYTLYTLPYTKLSYIPDIMLYPGRFIPTHDIVWRCITSLLPTISRTRTLLQDGIEKTKVIYTAKDIFSCVSLGSQVPLDGSC